MAESCSFKEGGGGELARFWVGMCPDRTKMQTLNLGKTFHWKTPKMYGNDTNLRIFCILMQKFFNMTLFKGKMSNFFLFLLMARAKFSYFTYYSWGTCIPGLQWELPHHPQKVWEKNQLRFISWPRGEFATANLNFAAKNLNFAATNLNLLCDKFYLPWHLWATEFEFAVVNLKLLW